MYKFIVAPSSSYGTLLHLVLLTVFPFLVLPCFIELYTLSILSAIQMKGKCGTSSHGTPTLTPRSHSLPLFEGLLSCADHAGPSKYPPPPPHHSMGLPLPPPLRCHRPSPMPACVTKYSVGWAQSQGCRAGEWERRTCAWGTFEWIILALDHWCWDSGLYALWVRWYLGGPPFGIRGRGRGDCVWN